MTRSVICDETNRIILPEEEFYCVTRMEWGFHCYLSKEVIERIPAKGRIPTRRSFGAGGVDIFKHIKGRTLFDPGEFLFSVSQETAEKYLPNHLKRYRETKR